MGSKCIATLCSKIHDLSLLEWTVCTLTSVQMPGRSSQELILCRQRSGRDPILVKIPMTTVNVDDAEDTELHVSRNCHLTKVGNVIMMMLMVMVMK